MAKARHTDLSEHLTPEQTVKESGQGMADLYFLMVPRQTLEAINEAAKARGMTVAEALGVAVERWLKEGDK